jgi:hypothetical protein
MIQLILDSWPPCVCAEVVYDAGARLASGSYGRARHRLSMATASKAGGAAHFPRELPFFEICILMLQLILHSWICGSPGQALSAKRLAQCTVTAHLQNDR